MIRPERWRAIPWFGLALAAGAAAAGPLDVPIERCVDGWCWEHPAVPIISWSAVASIDGALWIGGASGALMQFRDGRWTHRVVPEMQRRRNSVQGIVPSPGGVRVSGRRVYALDGVTFTALEARGLRGPPGRAGEAWVWPTRGGVWRQTGAALERVPVVVGGDERMELDSAGGRSAADLWAMGYGTCLVHFAGGNAGCVDGVERPAPGPIVPLHRGLLAGNRLQTAAGWTRVGSCGPHDFVVRSVAVRGSGPDQEVVAATDGGRLCVLDGTRWVSRKEPDEGHADAVAFHGGAAIAVGSQGTLWELRDGAVREGGREPGSQSSTHRAWASGPDDVWVAGGGFTLRYDGATWRNETSEAPALAGLDGTGPADVWALTHARLRHFDGTAWTEVDLPGEGQVWWALSAVSPGDLWVGSQTGTVARRQQGEWTTWSFPAERVAVWHIEGFSDGTALLGDSNGKVFHVDEGTPTERTPPAKETGRRFLHSLHARSSDDVWVAMSDGLHHWDGRAWTAHDLRVHHVFGSGEDLWVLAEFGVYRLEGDRWVEVGTAQEVLEVASAGVIAGPHVLVVGARGAVLRRALRQE